MYVILAVEWIYSNPPKQTQLSALRVNDEWEIVDSFNSIIKQIYRNDKDTAFGGIDWSLFENGESESECFSRLSSWLGDNDKLFIWNNNGTDFLFNQWLLYTGGFFPYEIRTVNKKIRSLCEKDEEGIDTAFSSLLADALEHYHCSQEFVEKLRALLCSLTLSPTEYLDKAAKFDFRDKKALLKNRAAQNKLKLERIGCSIAFTPNSTIFHRKDCCTLKYAVKIKGFGSYEQAIQTHRPCKLCKPQPEERPKNHSSNQIYRLVNLVDHGRNYVLQKNIVGRCRYIMHPGALTEKTLLTHDCINKGCRYFYKNPDSTYWIKLEQVELEKQIKKKQKKEAKAKKAEKDMRTESLKYEFQTMADELKYDFELVRVEELYRNAYRLFYVSDNRFADGNRFPELLEKLKAVYPELRIQLRHIKDIDGHFVTIDEYYSRRPK